MAAFSSGSPPTRGVAVVLGVRAGFDGRLHDVVGGREVRLTGAEADHRTSGGLEGLGLGVHGESGGLGDRADSGGDPALGGRGCSAHGTHRFRPETPPARGFHRLNSDRTSVRFSGPHQWIFSGGGTCGHFLFDARLRSTYTLTSLAFTGRTQPMPPSTRADAVRWGKSKGRSSIGRALVSKTSGWGFKSLRPCFTHLSPGCVRMYVLHCTAVRLNRARHGHDPESGEDE